MREGTSTAPYGRGFKSRPVHHEQVLARKVRVAPGGPQNSLLRGFARRSSKRAVSRNGFRMGYFRNLFSRDRIFGKRFPRRRFRKRDSKNRIPRTGFPDAGRNGQVLPFSERPIHGSRPIDRTRYSP